MPWMQRVRRWFRAWRRRSHWPILLPHHRLDGQRLCTLDRPPEPLGRRLAQALALCDGSNALSSIIRATGACPAAIMALHERQFLILWRHRLPAAPASDAVRTIILSPHLDDAALSMGGMMLLSDPGSVLVVDVFTRTPWSRLDKELADPARVEAIRQQEERLVARLTGANLMDFGLPEGLLRGYKLDELFRADPGPADEPTRAAIDARIAELAAMHPSADWRLPLGVGNHIDHRLVRDTALAVLTRGGIPEARISFYEDLPYAQQHAQSKPHPDFADMLPGRKLSPFCLDIEAVATWKVELNCIYWSQFGWTNIATLAEYARHIGYGRAIERTWRL